MRQYFVSKTSNYNLNSNEFGSWKSEAVSIQEKVKGRWLN